MYIECKANVQYVSKPVHYRFRCAAPYMISLLFPTIIAVLCTFIYCIYGGDKKPQSGEIFVVWRKGVVS